MNLFLWFCFYFCCGPKKKKKKKNEDTLVSAFNLTFSMNQTTKIKKVSQFLSLPYKYQQQLVQQEGNSLISRLEIWKIRRKQPNVDILILNSDLQQTNTQIEQKDSNVGAEKQEETLTMYIRVCDFTFFVCLFLQMKKHEKKWIEIQLVFLLLIFANQIKRQSLVDKELKHRLFDLTKEIANLVPSDPEFVFFLFYFFVHFFIPLFLGDLFFKFCFLILVLHSHCFLGLTWTSKILCVSILSFFYF